MYNRLKKKAASIGLCAALMLLAPASQAAIVSYNFSGSVDSGLLLGESYSGSFSYDDTGLAGSGSESVGLVSFAFNFLSSAFTLGHAEVTPSVDFLDGLLLGLSYSVSSNDPEFALIAASGLGLPGDTAYFSYRTVSGDSGFGSLAFDYTGTVDEPLALVMLGIGLVGIMGLRRR